VVGLRTLHFLRAGNRSKDVSRAIRSVGLAGIIPEELS